MADPNAKPKAIARELGVTTTTLYAHVNGDGSAKAAAEAVLRMESDVAPTEEDVRNHTDQLANYLSVDLSPSQSLGV